MTCERRGAIWIIPAAWYTHYASMSIENLEAKEIKKLEKERENYPKNSKKYM